MRVTIGLLTCSLPENGKMRFSSSGNLCVGNQTYAKTILTGATVKTIVYTQGILLKTGQNFAIMN